MANLIVQILLAVVALSLLIAWHEFGHYLFARLSGMKVQQFSLGMGPKLIGFTRSGIEYRIGVIPFGGYVSIAGMSELEEGAAADPRSFINRPFWGQFSTIAAGPVFNYFLAFVLFVSVFWFWSTGNTPSLLLNQVVKESAAAQAGIVEGDVLIKIDGHPITGSADFLDRIANSKGKALTFDLLRDKQPLTLQVTPRADEGGRFRVGVGYVPLSFSFGGAVKESLSNLWTQSTGILTGLTRAVIGSKSDVEFGGVVAITQQLSNAASQGFRSFLWLMGSLSVVLGLFNILPIPALDGSKLLFICVEKAAGRKIPAKVQIAVHLVGIVLLLGLMVLLTINDVLRIYRGS
jgi:regulator of sigma E protease